MSKVNLMSMLVDEAAAGKRRLVAMQYNTCNKDAFTVDGGPV